MWATSRPANVEEPGDRIGLGQQHGVGAEIGGDAGDLGLDGFAREGERLDRDRAGRRGRPVVPDAIDEVLLDRDELGAALGEALDQAPGLGAGVEPGVETDAATLRRVLGEPVVDGRGDAVDGGEGGRIDLGADLQRVAAVGEDGGALGERHGDAGGAGKAGQPMQPLGRGGHVFALEFVGARHEETIEADARHLGAQAGEAGGAEGGVGEGVEALEHGARV